ncbi:MAG: hypothetical protein K6F45_02200, partial [Saccharofermentans sp.]|nr:hypothetical protein [Saccharofermentans sp.]
SDGGLPSSINPLMLKQRPDLTPVCLLCPVISKQKTANKLLIFVSRFCCLGGGISAPGRWFVAENGDFSDFSANFSGLSLKMTISANFQRQGIGGSSPWV